MPLHLKQTFPLMTWIFTVGDGFESRLPFKTFSTLPNPQIDDQLENEWKMQHSSDFDAGSPFFQRYLWLENNQKSEYLLGRQVLPDQLAAGIWSLWKPTLPNIRILFAWKLNSLIFRSDALLIFSRFYQQSVSSEE